MNYPSTASLSVNSAILYAPMLFEPSRLCVHPNKSCFIKVYYTMSPCGLKGSSQNNFSPLSTRERKQIQNAQSVCKVGVVIHGTNSEMAVSVSFFFCQSPPNPCFTSLCNLCNTTAFVSWLFDVEGKLISFEDQRAVMSLAATYLQQWLHSDSSMAPAIL